MGMYCGALSPDASLVPVSDGSALHGSRLYLVIAANESPDGWACNKLEVTEGQRGKGKGKTLPRKGNTHSAKGNTHSWKGKTLSWKSNTLWKGNTNSLLKRQYSLFLGKAILTNQGEIGKAIPTKLSLISPLSFSLCLLWNQLGLSLEAISTVLIIPCMGCVCPYMRNTAKEQV